ncbi:MAG: response regulator, partial [Cytophagales bacterium]|nr:response regulator [Cytophagales bacterium]
MKHIVFIVENESVKAELIHQFFEKNKHFEFLYFRDSEECLNQLYLHPMAVFIDYDLKTVDSHERDGLKILEEIQKLNHSTEVIFFSSEDHPEVAMDTIKHGAYDYVVINENRFRRMENILFNIEDHELTKKSNRRFKTLTYLAVGFVI